MKQQSKKLLVENPGMVYSVNTQRRQQNLIQDWVTLFNSFILQSMNVADVVSGPIHIP